MTTKKTTMNVAVLLVLGIFANDISPCSAIEVRKQSINMLASGLSQRTDLIHNGIPFQEHHNNGHPRITRRRTRADEGANEEYNCVKTWIEYKDDINSVSECREACSFEHSCTGYEFGFETQSCSLFHGLVDGNYNRVLHGESRKLVMMPSDRLCYKEEYDQTYGDFNCFQGGSFVKSRPDRNRCRKLSLRRNAMGFRYSEEDQLCTIYDSRVRKSSQITERCEINPNRFTPPPRGTCPCYEKYALDEVVDKVNNGEYTLDVQNSCNSENSNGFGIYYKEPGDYEIRHVKVNSSLSLCDGGEVIHADSTDIGVCTDELIDACGELNPPSEVTASSENIVSSENIAPSEMIIPDCPCFNSDTIEHGLHLYPVDDMSSCVEDRWGTIGMYFIDEFSGSNPYFEVRSNTNVCVINGIMTQISSTETMFCRGVIDIFC